MNYLSVAQYFGFIPFIAVDVQADGSPGTTGSTKAEY